VAADGQVTQQQRAPGGRYARSPAELKQVIEAERRGRPFLLWRGDGGQQRIFPLDEHSDGVTVGRRSSCTIALDHDDQVSRTHAQLELVGEEWTVADDGLSRNGTFVNGHRVTARRRLVDGDVMRFGKTLIEFRSPRHEHTAAVTTPGSFTPLVENLTDVQRRILVALCRPYKSGGQYATPASNNDIAGEVFLGLDAVKNHLRLLFQRFGIADLPQNQKRARLVELAFQWGLVTDRDL
jgi:pSer/pThr/pTyr-binding forkhead associated (FHA) protein